jgi:hypothetical protein
MINALFQAEMELASGLSLTAVVGPKGQSILSFPVAQLITKLGFFK